jgi:hypothetical protein
MNRKHRLILNDVIPWLSIQFYVKLSHTHYGNTYLKMAHLIIARIPRRHPTVDSVIPKLWRLHVTIAFLCGMLLLEYRDRKTKSKRRGLNIVSNGFNVALSGWILYLVYGNHK